MAGWKMLKSIVGCNILLPVILHVARTACDSALEGHQNEHNTVMIEQLAWNEEW